MRNGFATGRSWNTVVSLLLLLGCCGLLGSTVPGWADPSRQPDLWIRNSTDTSYSGIGIYSTDGLNQTKTQQVTPGTTAVYIFRLLNNCGLSNNFTVTAPAGNSAFNVQYLLSDTGADITTQMASASGVVLGPLDPHATIGFYAKVTPTATAAPGASFVATVTAVPVIVTGRLDVIRAVTTAISSASFQPDVWIRNATESDYSGVGVYSTDGLNQTKTQTITTGQTAVFLFRVQNAGLTADNFTLTVPASNAAFTVRYFLTAFDVEITSQITGPNGLTVGPLTPSIQLGFYARVTPTAAATGGSSFITTVNAVSVSDPTKKDVARGVTQFIAGPQPDLWIRNSTDTTYAGVGIISATGANETKSQTVLPGGTATYLLRLVNAASTTDSFLVTATADNLDSTVRFFRTDTGLEISDQIFGNGYPVGPLATGGNFGFYTTVQTLNGSATAVTNVVIKAISQTATTQLDVARAVTTAQAPPMRFQPDLWIRKSTDTSYTGVRVFSTDGLSESRSFTVTTGVAAQYLIQVVNNGTTADSIRVTGTAGDSNWKVRYADPVTGLDLTTIVTGAGLTTATLAPGQAVPIVLQVTPLVAATVSMAKDVLVTGASVGAPTAIDVVRAATMHAIP